MWLDLIGLGVLGLFMLLGLLRGTLASVMRIISLVLAYGAAITLGSAFGPAVADSMSLPDLLGVPIAGSIAFAVTYLICAVAARLVQIWEQRRRGGEERSAADRMGGALFGGLQGAFLMLLIGWLGLWIDAGQATGALESLPDTSNSALGRVTQSVVEMGGSMLVDDHNAGARVALRMAARPKETMQGVQQIIENPRVRGLQQDRLFWAYVESGAIDAALNRPSFLGIAYDETLREELADVGLIQQHAATDARLFRNEARDALEQVSPRIRGLRNDPIMQELLNDPAVVAALQRGDHLALLQDPRFRKLVSHVMEGAPSQN